MWHQASFLFCIFSLLVVRDDLFEDEKTEQME